MFLGLSLLVVGVVLCLNGIWLTGRVQDREIILINAVAAVIFFAIALLSTLAAQQPSDFLDVAMTLLFGTTYLWVAYNRAVGAGGEGLGWFSGIVALSAAPMAVRLMLQAGGAFDYWLAACWAAWAGLWFVYFLSLGLKIDMPRTVPAATLFCGIFTGWLPGLLVLHGLAA